MNKENRPLSELQREAHLEWVDLDAAARLLEETKSLRFAQKCAALGDIPVNRAEQTIKASQDWMDDVIKTVDARTEANRARVHLEYLRTRIAEWQSEQADNRLVAKL